MTRNWTPAQERAIRTHGRTLLISAAAGSGKTATLTERIIRRLTDAEAPVELSRLLIVTFTRAAAAELRERIGAALTEAIARDPGNRHLQRQLLNLGGAHISTIDAFVREPVKAHFAELGLSATGRIADEAELMPLRERVMGDLMEEFYIRYAGATTGELFSLIRENPFADLCDSLTPSKNDEALIPTFLSLYEKLLAFPAGLDRLSKEANALERDAEGDFFASPHGLVLREWLGEFCASATETMERAMDDIEADEKASKAYGAAFSADLDFVRRLSAVTSYMDAYILFRDYKNARLSVLRDASPAMVAHKEARTALVKAIKDLGKTYFTDLPSAISQQMHATALMCRVLWDFLTEYDRRILAEKEARGISDFTDNRRYLLRLLRNPNGTPTPLAAELRAQYDEVYIDEYQDVDELQDEIFRLVGGDRRFMVGDIKQSIYGFRGADPSVFARYRRELPPLEADSEEPAADRGNSIFMSENFRCDEGVIRVTNAICGHILRACPNSVGYTEADDLGFGKKPPVADYTPPRVEIAVLTKPPKADDQEEAVEEDAEELSGAKAEATYVAGCIADLLLSGATLANGAPIRPRDIAILMRSTTSLSVYREALTAAGIPTGSEELDAREAGRDILHGGDMMYLCNLLRVIDNPDNDIPLSEVLRAPFPGLSLEEVLELRRPLERDRRSASLYACLETYAEATDADPRLAERLSVFVTWVERYRELCATLSADGILRLLARDEKCASRGSEAFRYLYESARTCRTATFVSLYTFLRYFEKKLLTTKNAVAAAATEDEGGHVSLMTIHKSKGLEFPVCFVVRCGQSFNLQSTTQDLLFEKRTGISMKLYHRGYRPAPSKSGEEDSPLGVPYQAKVDTSLRAAGALAIKLSEREEEMRVLYVAMTRARERLYLVGEGSEKPVCIREGDRYATLSASNYLKWVLAGLEAHPEVREFAHITYLCTADVRTPERLEWQRRAMTSATEETSAGRYRAIVAMHREPTAMELLLSRVPTKVPAARMSARLLDECVFYNTDTPTEEDGKLPVSIATDTTARCDAQSVASIREALRLMNAESSDNTNEFELLLAENRRPTAAERGTAAHLFLQYCRYDYVARDGLEAEIARLGEMGYLNERTVQILDRATLRGFFDSRFFARMQEAVSIERELRFNRFIPLSTLTEDPAFSEALGERLLYVQGSIDLVCVFPDGHMELCDYKTDHITAAERQDPGLLAARMKEKHGEQLRQYAAAVTELYGRAPEKVYIYSLPLCEAVEIAME